jgi:hypothetical protein
MFVRVTRLAGGRTANQTPAPTTAEATNAAATGPTSRRHNDLRGRRAADAAPAGGRKTLSFLENEPRGRDGGHAMPTILDQATVKQRAHRLRHIGRECLPIRFEADHSAEDVCPILAVECAAAREHLVQHAAERPDVAPLVGLVSLRLFGGHVGGRTENHADARHQGRRRHRFSCDVDVVAGGVRVRELREAEVQDFHGPVRPQLDVGRLQVAVDDSLVVRRLERLGDLFRDADGIVKRDRAAPQPLRQVLAFHQLHDEGAHITRFFETVDVGDVRVVQGREGLGFACETCDPVGIVPKVAQHLDRNVSIEPGVARAIDLAHAARADQRDDFVRAEASTGRQRHEAPEEPRCRLHAPVSELGARMRCIRAVCPLTRRRPAT